ncbi:MAG: MBL fold metallo-hydrolase [Alkaliphilus sp.]
MILKVLGSSSKGNCYLLQSDKETLKETLIIECGVSFLEVKKSLNFDLSSVVGCLITHEHKDHCKYVENVFATGIKVFASGGTIKQMGVNGHLIFHTPPERVFSLGGYTILPFSTKHDCIEPLGFLIKHKEMGTMLFATDTYYLEYVFENLNHILIECNYSNEILDRNIEKGYMPKSLKKRVLFSHFSLDNVKDFLKANDMRTVNNIVLLHLSDANSNAKEFKSEIESLTGKMVYVADKGLEIDLSLCPF